MKKIVALLICFLLLTMSLNLEKADAAGSTSIIDEYIKINSVTKGNDNKITVKYTVKKNVRAGTTFTANTLFHVYGARDFRAETTLKTKKGTYTATFKPKRQTVGPQYVNIKAVVGGRYNQEKKVKTFYKYPPSQTTTHTLTKKQAVAQHIVITAGIASFKLAAKRTPYGVALNLAAYGSASTYTLKGLGVVGGYPTPVAGQYIRTPASYNSKGLLLTSNMWQNYESYKKGVSPIWKYKQQYSW